MISPTGRTAGGSSRHNLETTEESEYEMQDGEDPGVRYITESLIQKVSKQENVTFVTSLNLSLSKDGGKKFKVIENLEKCERLEVLNLSHNLIQKMEKLERQTRLRELNLSYNRISKIEALEHMQNLQKLNLSANEIEHIPAWMGKKMKALRALNLKQNLISSLQDVSRLKPLRDLTSLFLAYNPVANLPHYRLYLIFHLRSLDSLDGQTITDQERQEAHSRFSLEEVEKLERDLEKKVKEVEDLQNQKTKILSDLHSQDQLSKTLRQEALQQKKSYKELEREMDTKNEILKQKTLELTRACQKQYELEQELAFYKIDAKFEPLGYLSPEEADDEVPGESPYIGKARYKRNLYAQEGHIPNRAQRVQVGRMEVDTDGQITNQQIRARIHTTMDIDLNEKERNIQEAETKLSELRQEIVRAEEQIVNASEELKELEDAVTQKKVSGAEKDRVRHQLGAHIRILKQLRDEALELERQMERQRQEMGAKQREIQELQRHLQTLSPQDPRHSHVNSQKISKERQLEMMNQQYQQLEGRLDDMLSRIARETEEIKDLEQQLTEGQIAANDALKRDLEGIISGLQEYLESVKGQAWAAQDQCRQLQGEREDLLQRLEELEEETERLEAAAQETENIQKEVEELERSLQEQQEENEALRQAQGDLRTYEAELENQVRAREEEIARMKEELEQRKKQQQAENSAWKAERERDRCALENALTETAALQERNQDHNRLMLQVQQLQSENASLRAGVEDLGARLSQAVQDLVAPEQISARVSELKRKLQTGVGEIRCSGPSDVLGQNLVDLQQLMTLILTRSEEERRSVEERQRRLQEEMAALQERARDAPDDYKKACNKAAEARIQQEKRLNEAKMRDLETEVRRLSERLNTMEDIQGLADQQLLEAEEERERLMGELHDLETERRTEDSRAQRVLSSLGQELKELKRAVTTSDNMAASELTSTKDQLRSLHGTVLQINKERAEEMKEAENYCSQAARASRDLLKAEAEIELLQELLHDKEKQLQDELQNAEAGVSVSNSQQLEIDRLSLTLCKQRAETERLRHLLEHANADNAGEMENLLDEIEALRRALGYQSDYISSMADPFRRKGYWYYLLPSSNNSVRDSLSTKDSGVSLHSPMTSSPAKRTSCHHQHWKKEAPTGHWVYSTLRPVGGRCHDGEVGGDPNVPPSCPFVPPPGSVIYTVFPDGSPVPPGSVIYGPPPASMGAALVPGTVIYGPPPVGTQYVYGPPPPQFTVPVIPAGVLHCNVSAHHDLENELSRLEVVIDHMTSRRLKEKRLKEDITVLEEQSAVLRREVRHLRDSARKRKDFVDGHLEGLMTELEHHGNVQDEVSCLEKTLRRRRAELREADRLLAEAESEVKDTQEKTMEIAEKYKAAKKQLCHAESDAEELERRAQETAVNLVKADQQLRMLQANTRDLEQHRAAQEIILQEINSVMAAKDTEFQSLNRKMEVMSESLQKLQEEIRAAEGKESERYRTVMEAEDLVMEKRRALEQLQGQISAQQEEAAELDGILGQKRQELHLIQSHILRDREGNMAEKRKEVKEVNFVLEDLSVQKGEVSAQLSEKRSQLSVLRQDILEEQEELQKMAAQIHKQKCELKHILEMQQLEDNELQGLKLQHGQKVSDLEKTQTLLLQGKLELEDLQTTLQRVQGEVESQRKLLETDHQEVELLMTQMKDLQDTVQALSRNKEVLENNNHQLEHRLIQSKKELTDTEERRRMASAALERLEEDIRRLQKERSHQNEQQRAVQQETTAAQQILEDKTEELKCQLSDMKEALRLLEEDLRTTTKQRDKRFQDLSSLQEKELRLEERLGQLQRCAEEEEAHLKQITKEQKEREDQMRAAAAKLETDRQNYQRELCERQKTLDIISRRVSAQEERAQELQQEERWCAALEESLDAARRLLSEREVLLQDKTREVTALEEKMAAQRSDLRHLQDEMTSGRKMATVLKETANLQRLQLEEAAEILKRQNSSLKEELRRVERAAHDNHERATRLLKELKLLQAEHSALQKQLRSQEELDRRQQEVNEAVRALKAQVKQEIQSSLQELQFTAADGPPEGEEPEENRSLREEYPFSANPLPSRSHILDEQWRGEALREKLLQQEDRLRAQLHQRMSSQAAALSRGRQQTEGSLHSLRRRLDALDDLVSNAAPFHSPTRETCGLPQTQAPPTSRSQDGAAGPGVKSLHILDQS